MWALARAQTYVSLQNMGSYTQVSMTWYVFSCHCTYVWKQGFEVWALAREETYVSSHNTESYTKVSVIWNMYTCEYMYVCKEVLSVSTHKVTNICKFAPDRFIHKWSHDMMYIIVYMYMYTSGNVDVYKKVQSVSTRKGHTHMLVCTAWDYVQEYR